MTPLSTPLSLPSRLRPPRWYLSLLCLAGFLGPAVTAQVGAREADEPAAFDFVEAAMGSIPFRHVGPLGNRVPAVVGVPGDPNVYFAGSASGGIFRSTDGGHHWQPVFDDTPAASIGALAVAPSDPNVVWAGTGEAFLRSNISIGNGVYRSTDGGTTWQHLALDDTGRISRVVVDPRDPDIAFVAALGSAYAPSEERGVFRTRDGGETWERVLFVDQDTGASDLVMDPNNPRILYAGTWHIELRTHSRRSGGPGSGLWRTKDGGDTWQRLEGGGLPTSPWGKVALTLSADDSDKVYALIETSSNREFAPSDPYQGALWRSTDGGDAWTLMSADNNLHQRPLYYSRMLAVPDDADELHFMAVRHSVSTDGGATIETNNSGWDHHDIWIDPQDPDRIVTGHDGGVSISTDGGRHWYSPQLPIAQMYHVAVDRQVPYNVYGNRQDGFAVRGPSRTFDGGEIPVGAWQSVGGCEVGFTLPHPADPNLVWAGCYDGILTLYDERTKVARDVSAWPESVESWHGAGLRYRWQWTVPMIISPHDPETVYIGSQFVHRTTDRGQSWEVISPDLTTDDPELQKRTGGLTLDDAGPTLGPTLFALAESPRVEGTLWAGTNDGQVQRSGDGGATWTNLTAHLPGLPRLGTVSNIEPSRHADGVVYLSVDAHQEGDARPYVYRTDDHGASWTKIVDGITQSVFSYVHVVREDPEVPGLLYAGTENAIYVSLDDGASWRPFASNLPPAPVHWLEIQEDFGDLVVGTYGRGIWIADDLSPLRAAARASDTEQGSEGPALLAPRVAYRFRDREGILAHPRVPAAGTNPESGAVLHLVIPDEIEGALEIEIVDAAGAVVRTLDEIPTEVGVHRAVWDLRTDPSTKVELRTKPEENPHVAVPEDPGYRELSDGWAVSRLVVPGTYGVRLVAIAPECDDCEVDDEGSAPSERSARTVVAETTLELRKDPTSGGSLEGIEAQQQILEGLWRGLDVAGRMINEIEWTRAALDDLEIRLDGLEERERAPARSDEVRSAAASLDEELRELEGRFFDLRLTGASQDTLRWPRLLYSRMSYLFGFVERGDERPTDSQVEVYELLRARLAEAEARYEEIRAGSAAGFDELLTESSLGGIGPGPVGAPD